MPNLLQRLRARLRNRRFDADLAEELRVHEQMKREALEAVGVSPLDARAYARRALGNVALMREESRRVWIASWLEAGVQDVRYAGRTLLRQPVHTVTAGTVLVLAIALNTSLFTIFKGLALEPWPVKDPGSIVRIWARADGRPVGPSVDEYRFLREHVRSFSGLVAHSPAGNGARLRVPGRAGPRHTSRPSGHPPTSSMSSARACSSAQRFIHEDDVAGNRRAPLVMSDSSARWIPSPTGS